MRNKLAEHDWVEYTALCNPLSWRFTNSAGLSVNVKVRPKFSTNTAEGALALVRAGVDISVATGFSSAQDPEIGRLIRLLRD